MRRADFVSVGSNDLFQFFYASDRGNPRVSARYDPLSAASLRALRDIVAAARRHEVPLNLCGEMAGRPLEAMALIGLGFRSISMAPASIGPVKTMILSLDSRRIAERLAELLSSATGGLRAELQAFAEGDSIEI
jgi:phosphotransferase system enzyme I (PtsP)